MTPRPTTYEGLKEKLFWWTLGSIGTGIIAMVGMVWGLTVDIKIIQHDRETDTKLLETTVEMSTMNNSILSKKADDSTNRIQHNTIMVKMDSLKIDFDKLSKVRQGYGSNNGLVPDNLTLKQVR